MSIDRRGLVIGLALGCGSLAATSVFAQAAPWPNKPIRYIVPFAAGGTTDILARVVGEKLGAALGQTIVVENKAGQGGSVGAAELARAAPDGYTIGGGTISSHAINATLYDKLPYDPVKSFAPITLYRHAAERAAGASQRAGEQACASSSCWSRPAPASTRSARPASAPRSTSRANCSTPWPGVKMQHIPYKGSGPMIPELLGGTIDVAFDNIATACPHIKAGKLRALAVTTATRSGAVLAALFSTLGIFGAYIVGVKLIGIDAGAFWGNMQAAVDFRSDIVNGIIKSFVFGAAVSLIAVFEGYDAKPTAEGVSSATTRTVVESSLAILALDFVLTVFMFHGVR